MTLTTISGSGGASFLTQNLGKASGAAARSVGRLSSGRRIATASDDVAGLAVSTRLSTVTTSLRQARQNMAQAVSLMQVTDGALSQTQELLQRMNALAVQSSSGSLTAVERGFLNQEFQQLGDEIDRIATQTQFGGLTPLMVDSTNVEYVDAVATDDALADSQSAMLVFGGNWTANNRWIRLGTFDTSPNERFFWRNNPALGDPDFNFQNSSSLSAKLQSMVERWNDPNGAIQQDERFSRVKMELVGGNMVKVTSLARGDLAQLFAISDQSAHTDVRNAMSVLLGDAFQRNGSNTLFNYVLGSNNDGSDTGLGMGSVVATGGTGDGILQSINQQAGEVRLHMTGNFVNNQQLRIDNGQTSTINFVFRTNPTNAALHIKIGKDTVETLDNAVTFLNNWVELQKNTTNFQQWYGVANLTFSREGNDLVIRSALSGKPVDLFGNDFNFVETLSNGTLNNGVTSSNNLNMVGGSDVGVNASGVANKDFYGTLQGFAAQYMGKDEALISLQVGDATYSAHISDTLIAADDRIRFFSENNGYFDVDVRSGHGLSVSDQSDADRFAALFDAAFSGVNFYQQRTISNFQPSASSPMAGMRLSITTDDFSSPMLIEDFNVTAADANGGSAQISMMIDGEEYRSQQLIDRGIRATARVELINVANTSKKVTLDYGGTTAIDLDTASQAKQFEDSMREALPFGYAKQSQHGAVSFQAGRLSENEIQVETYNATTDALFDQAMDILTVSSAQQASDAVLGALDAVTEMRANNGARQQQANVAMNNIESSLRSQDEAHGQLADTDMARESTAYASEYVKVNASISLISQVNQLRRDLVGTLLAQGA